MILRIIADTKSALAQERRSLSAESGNWPLRGQGMPFSLRAPALIGLNASPVNEHQRHPVTILSDPRVGVECATTAMVDGVVALSAAQMSYLLEAIDWRNPQHTWRPQSAG
jgi:hypothetical protein